MIKIYAKSSIFNDGFIKNQLINVAGKKVCV